MKRIFSSILATLVTVVLLSSAQAAGNSGAPTKAQLLKRSAAIQAINLLLLSDINESTEVPHDRSITAYGSNQLFLLLRGKRYAIPHLPNNPAYRDAVMESWGWTMFDVHAISQSALEKYPVGENVTIRPGTFLLKTAGKETIYLVEKRGLRPVDARVLPNFYYGTNWQEIVLTVPDAFFADYKILPDGITYIPQEPGYYGPGAGWYASSTPRDFLHKYNAGYEILFWDNQAFLLTSAAVAANRYNQKFVMDFWPKVIALLCYRDYCWYTDVTGYGPDFDYNPE